MSLKGLRFLAILLVVTTNSMANNSPNFPKLSTSNVSAFSYENPNFWVNDAMNEMLSQSILSQTIAKVFVAVANDQLKAVYSEKLFELVELFEKKMVLLNQYLPDKVIKAALEDVEIIWQNYKAKVSSIEEINQGDISIVLIQAKSLSDACHDVLIRINDYAKTTSPNRAISKQNVSHSKRFDELRADFKLSNDLAILNQSIALFYILEMEASIFPTSNTNLWNAVDDFEAKFKEIQASTRHLNFGVELLKDCVKEWAWIKKTALNPSEAGLKELLQRHERLAKNLFELSQQYKNQVHDTYMDASPETRESNQVQITEN